MAMARATDSHGSGHAQAASQRELLLRGAADWMLMRAWCWLRGATCSLCSVLLREGLWLRDAAAAAAAAG
jgi:hypothetical protein